MRMPVIARAMLVAVVKAVLGMTPGLTEVVIRLQPRKMWWNMLPGTPANLRCESVECLKLY
jgi:hypothetical protein